MGAAGDKGRERQWTEGGSGSEQRARAAVDRGWERRWVEGWRVTTALSCDTGGEVWAEASDAATALSSGRPVAAGS